MNKKIEGIYGVNPLLEALRAGNRHFDKVHVAKGTHGSGVEEIIEICRGDNIPVYFESRESLDRIAGTKKNQGIFATTTVKGYSSIEEILSIAEKRRDVPFVLILDSIEDPRNLGAIIRTADGAGVHGVIIPKHGSSGLSSTVAKTSAGAVEYVPVSRETNLVRAIEFLQKKGLWIYGVDLKGEKKYTDVTYDIPLGIVIGSEGRGIRESIRKACDVTIRIPLFGRINSLNVSVATGIILFEIAKHRIKE